MPENTQPDQQPEQTEHPEVTEPQPRDSQHDLPVTGGPDAPEEGATPDSQVSGASTEDTAGSGNGENANDGVETDLPTETVTTYERTAEGHRVHRVTRRTVQRKEVTEDTQETETETETYPAGSPVPYQPPTPAHPAPVG